MPSSSPVVFFIAGDPSGDLHAARVIQRLTRSTPGVRCIGIGGPEMQRQGFESLLPFDKFNRMGFVEVLRHLPFFLKARARIIGEMQRLQPRVCVLVDYPGFNMGIMKAAKQRGIPVLWYIVPQVWAWKRKRSAVLGRHADIIATAFPFETAYFSGYPARHYFVGHPLVEQMLPRLPSRIPRQPANASVPDTISRIALIPGSRGQEIRIMLPRMVRAFALLKERYPAITALVSRYPHGNNDLFASLQTHHSDITVCSDPLPDILGSCDCAFVTSGTATLQTALMQVPMVIVYRTSALTYLLLKRFVHLPFIGLPNIVAGEKIVPECIQEQATPQHLAYTMRRYFEDPDLYRCTVAHLADIRAHLGSKSPSTQVSEFIRSYCNE
jgi:lipid-A-disaccharide synthase